MNDPILTEAQEVALYMAAGLPYSITDTVIDGEVIVTVIPRYKFGVVMIDGKWCVFVGPEITIDERS